MGKYDLIRSIKEGKLLLKKPEGEVKFEYDEFGILGLTDEWNAYKKQERELEEEKWEQRRSELEKRTKNCDINKSFERGYRAYLREKEAIKCI